MDNKNTIDVKKGLSAGIFTILKGKVSNFNQGLIICFSTLLTLIFICIFNFGSHPKIFIPLFHFSIKALFALIVIGIIRNWFAKPEFPITASFVGLNRKIEMRNVPKSMLTKELFMTVAALVYPENEPPVGLIEGNVKDAKSIRMLTEEERKQLQEKEREEIQKHQHKIAEEIRKVQQAVLLEQAAQTNTNDREKQAQNSEENGKDKIRNRSAQ